MTTPKEKHPNLDLIAESPQGREFLWIIDRYLGGRIQHEPVASIGAGHLFVLSGTRGRGLLAQSLEEREEGNWYIRWGFVSQPADLTALLVVTFDAFRRDPSLKGSLDDRVPPFSSNTPQQERRAGRGFERDRFGASMMPLDRRPSELAAISWDAIVGVLDEWSTTLTVPLLAGRAKAAATARNDADVNADDWTPSGESEEVVVHEEGLVAWIAEQTDLPRTFVSAVLDLEFDYMVAAGIVSPSEDYEPLYYVSVQPDDERNVDVDRLARDSERLLAIPAAEAELILASETEYLAMRGLVTEMDDGEYPEESV